MELDLSDDKEPTKSELERIAQHCANDSASCSLRINEENAVVPMYVCMLVPSSNEQCCHYNGNILTYEDSDKKIVTRYECAYLRELANKFKLN